MLSDFNSEIGLLFAVGTYEWCPSCVPEWNINVWTMHMVESVIKITCWKTTSIRRPPSQTSESTMPLLFTCVKRPPVLKTTFGSHGQSLKTGLTVISNTVPQLIYSMDVNIPIMSDNMFKYCFQLSPITDVLSPDTIVSNWNVWLIQIVKFCSHLVCLKSVNIHTMILVTIGVFV